MTGSTTAKKLWERGQEGVEFNTSSGCILAVQCECCTSYQQWKGKHSLKAIALQKLADELTVYQIFSKQQFVVYEIGREGKYTGTIKVLQGSPKGQCIGVASSTGPHPYVCTARNVLVHGKTSILNRRLLRNSTLDQRKHMQLRAAPLDTCKLHSYAEKTMKRKSQKKNQT